MGERASEHRTTADGRGAESTREAGRGPRRVPYPYSVDPPDRLDPDPLYARLRADEPVAWVRPPYGGEAWLATRYDTVRRVMSDPQFSRALAVGPETPRPGPIWAREDAILSLDPPDHTRLRRLVAPAFTVRQVERLRPRATEIAERLLDDMAKQDPPADLVDAVAMPLPVMVICDILGVPYADREKFGRWSRIIMSTTTHTQQEVDDAYRDLAYYVEGLVVERRAVPTDDMLSVLVQAHDEGDRLSADELVAMAINLLVNGHETTANQIANFVYLLLTHPDQLAWLRADLPGRVAGAVEELLRFVPLAAGAPASGGHARIAIAEVELDGVTVAPGEAVLPAANSANRDSRVFADADRLDLSRTDNPHITFGYGPHRCLGAPLARLELQVILSVLLRRFPALRLGVPADQVPWKVGLLQRGPAELFVAW